MDEVMLKSGTWPNVAIEAGGNLKAMKPAPVENRSVFDEDEEPEATPARFAEARKVIQTADSYKLDDTREQLEADTCRLINQMIDDAYDMGLHEATWCASQQSIRECVKELLDRQAAIARAEVFEDGEYDCMTCGAKRELQERVDTLTAEVEAQRKRANDAERGVLSEAWYVSRDRYEDDIAELRHANSLLQSTIAELGVKADEKQAELLEARASCKADPVKIQLTLARFAEEWVLADTRVQEQRCIVYHAQHIADLVDNPGGGE